MSNTKHLEWIYDRLVHVHGENPNYDYMYKFKSIIEENNLREAYLLKAVHDLVDLKFNPLNQNLALLLSNPDFEMDEELKVMIDILNEKEDLLYAQYGVTRQKPGKIESNENS